LTQNTFEELVIKIVLHELGHNKSGIRGKLRRFDDGTVTCTNDLLQGAEKNGYWEVPST
jgi:hypothetical protein